MCGIVGAFDFGGSRTPPSLVTTMANTIRHRGPDDSGTHASDDARVTLGSRRLSIIDLSAAGHMPMCNEDRTVWVAFNGEIYNFPALRSWLVSRGHRFASHTDTEVLVHLYEEKGSDFLEALDGMFAIALWDEQRGELLLARDRLGEKPLYFAEQRDSLRFASEIKALLADPAMPRSLDLEALNQYLTFGFVSAPRTMFAGIRKLGPGEILTIGRGGTAHVRRFWSPMAEPEDRAAWRAEPLEWHVREVRRHLERSVGACLIADVPVGAFLSGGVDSSAVVALMARLTGRPIECVTVTYPGQPVIDESPFAAAVASHVGARLHRVEISEADAFESVADCVYHLDEPIADPAGVSSYFGSRFLRGSGVPVALVGEGADELFLGYGYYLRHSRLAPVWRSRRMVPGVVRRAMFASLSPLMGPLGVAAHRDLARRAAHDEGLFLSSEPFFPDGEKRQLTGGALRAIGEAGPSAAITDRVIAEANHALDGDVIAQMGFAESRMRLAEKLLMRVDKLTMAHSVEVRAPLLDHHLARYALSLPGSVRTAGKRSKGLLKLAVSDLLPAETLTRAKVGFSTPVAHWFRSSFGDRLESMIDRSPLFRDGLLNGAEMRRILREHRGGRAQHHTKLWNVFCLLAWAERYGVSIGADARAA